MGDSLLVFGTHRREAPYVVDPMLMYLDHNGNVLDTVIGHTPEWGEHIAHGFLTNSRTLIVCGSLGSDTIFTPGFIAEITPNAEYRWTTILRFPGAGSQSLSQGCRAANGNYFFVGTAWVGTSTWYSPRIWMVLCDSTGQVIRQDTLNWGGVCFGYAVCATTDGGFVVGGSHPGISPPIFKVDSSANLMWMQLLTGPSSDIDILNALELPGGHILISGTIRNNSVTGHDLYIARLAPDGEIIWQRQIYYPNRQKLTRMLLMHENRILLAATHHRSDMRFRVMLVTLELDGTVRTLELIEDGDNTVDVAAVLQLADSTIVVAGSGVEIHGTGIYPSGYYAARYAAERPVPFSPLSGCRLLTPTDGSVISPSFEYFRWSPAYDPDPFDSVFYSLSIRSESDSVVLANLTDTSFVVRRHDLPLPREGAFTWSVQAHSSRPYSVVYSDTFTFYYDPVGLDEIIPIAPDSPVLAAYPNPFNAQAQIRFALPQTGRATLTIYDLAGREVAVIANETFAAGEHAIAWNAAGLPSGVYFARLYAGKFSATRKLLLLP